MKADYIYLNYFRMKNALFVGLGVLAVTAVAGAAIYTNGFSNMGSQFQGKLNLPGKPVGTQATTLPGKTGDTHVAGATCIAFIPAELKESHGVRIGPASLNTLKFKGCDKAKVKKVQYNLSGQNTELQPLKITKDGQDVSEMLTKDSKDKLMQANTYFNKMVGAQNYNVDLEFQNAMEFTPNDDLKIESNFSKFDTNTTFKSNLMNVTYQKDDYTLMKTDYPSETVTMTYRDSL